MKTHEAWFLNTEQHSYELQNASISSRYILSKQYS